MALALILIIITLLCGSALCREFKSKNTSATIMTGSSTILFGFLSITTIITSYFQ
ncbi:DUF2759 family protein [Paraliobacillus sp. X-1268]|uniref:DUF2759 family protein n=1 Tax=Paraliobacillus TaxID=200903 RepID=UPI000DD3BADB|nr:DUF2759 family protein [Paraliobacillus sp. X-1268]